MVRVQLGRQLEIRLVALGRVRELAVGRRREPAARRETGEGLQETDVKGGTADPGREVRPAIGRKEPGLVADQRAADREVGLVDLVRGGRSGSGPVVGRRVEHAHGGEVRFLGGERVETARQFVVAEEAGKAILVSGAPVVLLMVVGRGGGEFVTAAPGDDVDDQPGTHRVLGLGAAGLDRGVLDHVGAHAHVGDLGVVVAGCSHSLDLDDVGEVLGRVAEIDHAAGTVVERTGVDARGHLEEVAPVAAGLDGQVALELTLDGEDVAGTGDFEHRGLGGDRDGFFHLADGHHHVHTDVRAGADQDAFLAIGGEAGQRCLDRELANRQVQEAIAPLAVRDADFGSDQRRARGRYGHARKHRPRVVGDRAADAGVAALSEREGRKGEGRCEKQRESGLPHGSSSVRCLRFQGCGPTAPVPR